MPELVQSAVSWMGCSNWTYGRNDLSLKKTLEIQYLRSMCLQYDLNIRTRMWLLDLLLWG